MEWGWVGGAVLKEMILLGLLTGKILAWPESICSSSMTGENLISDAVCSLPYWSRGVPLGFSFAPSLASTMGTGVTNTDTRGRQLFLIDLSL